MPMLQRPLAAVLVPALLLLVASHRAAAQLHFPKIDTSRITNSIGKANPAKAAEALTHGGFDKVAEAIKDAASSSNFSDVQQAAQVIGEAGKRKVEEAKGALQDLRNGAPANVSEALRVAPRGQIVDVIRAAAGSLQKGAEAINRTSRDDLAEGVSSALQGAQDTAAKAAAKASSAASPREVASTLQGHAPKVAGLLNRTGLQVAGVLQAAAPRAAEAIRRAGPRKELGGGGLPSGGVVEEAAAAVSASRGPLLAVLLLALASMGGVCAWRQLKSGSARTPSLLADGDLGVQMRGPRMQQSSSDEPFFTQF